MNGPDFTPQPVTHPTLGSIARVRHGFFGRTGGESSALYAGNNCGFGTQDDPDRVSRNRARCIARLGLSTLVAVTQRHTPDVVVVSAPWDRADAPVADAMVTTRADVALGILTADCAPVLFADASSGVIGAAHAGWRGAFDGVLEATVKAMQALGTAPARIKAVVGPCIGHPSYEVGPEFVARFVEREPAFARYFTPAGERSHFDLTGFAMDRLRAAGVGTVAAVDRDTCAEDQAFFSYRRSVLRREPDYGRQLSVIGLAP